MKMNFLIITGMLISNISFALPYMPTNLKYKTSFGSCPSRAAGTLALNLMKEFEKTGSLRVIKSKIEKEHLEQKHFISSYKIDYDPLRKMINFSFDCPNPLMKVQLYKSNGLDSYDAILVDTGDLFDPTYEVLLRSESLLKDDLPTLAIPVGEMDDETKRILTELVKKMPGDFRSKLSEIILSEKKDLTIILSLRGRPSSVFLGLDDWSNKLQKLIKVVGYMESKKKIPAIINLTNAKKVVVKFSDRF